MIPYGLNISQNRCAAVPIARPAKRFVKSGCVRNAKYSIMQAKNQNKGQCGKFLRWWKLENDRAAPDADRRNPFGRNTRLNIWFILEFGLSMSGRMLPSMTPPISAAVPAPGLCKLIAPAAPMAAIITVLKAMCVFPVTGELPFFHTLYLFCFHGPPPSALSSSLL